MKFEARAPRGAGWRGLAAAGVLSLGLAACGGGGGGGGSTAPAPDIGSPPPTSEVLQPSSTYAQRCAPDNPNASPSQKTASLAVEKQWIRAYVDEAYLWRDEVPAVDPARSEFSGSDVTAALDRYFEALKSPKLTDSGARRDQFSFTLPTLEWTQLADSGVEAGYGIEWNLASPTPPRRIRVAYVEANSAAARAGVQRGDELISVDGFSADTGDSLGVDRLNEALFPSALGAAHSFSLMRAGIGIVNQTLVSASVAKTPVMLRQVLTAADGSKVGHLVFNDHVLPAEAQLIEAVSYFKAQGVSDLVLDMRYNGGGYLFIASELAYMIAGPSRINGRIFERLGYNSRRSAETRDTPFYPTSCGLVGTRCTNEQALPTLNLSRVYVLTQAGTCSASESVINGLRGVDVDVIQIGGKTCGKPYGFTAKDNCGISYFPIEFVGVNAKGFGEYADGFTPVAPAASGGRKLPGCEVADDFTRALGDPAEGLLAAALSYRRTGQCPVGTGVSKALAARSGEGLTAMDLRRSPVRTNRIGGVR